MIWDAPHVEISAPHPQCTALTDTSGSMKLGTQLTCVWTDEERINLNTTLDQKQQQKATVHSESPPSSSLLLLHLHDNNLTEEKKLRYKVMNQPQTFTKQSWTKTHTRAR